MNKTEVVKSWRKYVKPVIVEAYGASDKYALRESWNDFTDSLAKSGQITWNQCDTWTQPKECA